MAADPNNPNVVYWGTRDAGQVFRHPNIWAGNVWNHDIIAATIGDVRDIEVDSDSKVYVAASDGLWRWDGSGWIKFAGLPTDDITALAIGRSTNPSTLYVGTGDCGVFVSQDGGNTWIPFNEGLGNFNINELAISTSQPKMLYAGTEYGGVWSNENYSAPIENIFDTGSPENPYPSIMGNHTGTIKPNHTVIATKLYTYPCSGTGGHTKYVKIWNLTWNTTATWKGYIGDWHNISFNNSFTLIANKTYNYIIRTGSYPQIHHNRTLIVPDGEITCKEFIDANGKRHNNWIPAVRLE